MRTNTLSMSVLFFLLACHLTPGTASAATDTLKIYLLVGQSNMEGQAYTYDSGQVATWNVSTMEFLLSGTPQATDYLAAMPFDFKNSLDASWMQPRDDVWGVHYDSHTGNTKNILPTKNPADIVTGIQPMMPGFGVGTNFGSMIGAELGMGHRLGDAMQSPVFLFKSDKGGTTLGNDWRPPTAVAARGGSVGPEYTNTMNRFTGFMDTLDADLADDGTLNAYNNATGYEVAAVFWFQGWNEQYDDGPYTKAQLQAEYTDNLKDLIYSIRAADPRIPDDLGIIIGESSDQHAGLNASRIAAVAQLNDELPSSAVYFDTANMKGTSWGNNNSGAPFSQGWGYHFHARAENFLEIGWKAGEAALENGFTGSEAVPEPSTVAMLMAGLMAMALYGRRRR
ncbi:MAG: PEP-CTERM sorting domain-containing protein [Candidatus Nealsonbacteria bacterium]|nr:PEP-CTERM sorting domain-containing protein [Candidatus Nealsonbacteria bacterium]